MKRALLLVLLCGCDPDVELVGKVLATDGGVSPGTPVRLECTGGPQKAVPASTVTTPQGRFALRGTGCLPTDCKLIAGEGLDRGEAQLMEFCRKTAPSCGAGTCSAADVTLKLR